MSLREHLSDWLWPGHLLLRQWFRAGFQTAGITVTVLAAAFSIVLPLLFPNPAHFLEPIVHRGWLAFSLAVAGFAGLLLLSGFLSLWTADPETYARLRLSGRPAKEVLYTTSREIRRICKRTSRKTLTARPTMIGIRADRGGPGFPEPQRKRVDKQRRKAQKLLRTQRKRLARTEAMKILVSREWDIPQRRLCDHVFQFSPIIFRDRLQKYLANWEEIFALRETNNPGDINRIRTLIHLNRSFLNNVKRRVKYQDRVLENRDLHPYIVDFASTHSSSGSLHTYANALKFVAETGMHEIKQHSEGQMELPEKARKEITHRLLFLQRKQRAHPGFDLHTLLCRAVECIREESDSLPGAEAVEALLRALFEFRDEEPRESLIAQVNVVTLTGLSQLPVALASFVSNSRAKIYEQFLEVFDRWFQGGQKAPYIVSHGYSKTVLSVILKLLDREKAKAREDRRIPRLFFALPEIHDTFDARVMEYEIKEDRERRPLCDLAAGSDRHLLGLLAPNDAVLIVIGAESFNRDRTVVHPRGIGSGLDILLKQLSENRIRSMVIVVAEGYKLQKDPLNENSTFYRQHFDRIDLYPPGCIHLIVSDQGTWPNPWQPTLESRWRVAVPLLTSPPSATTFEGEL
jgi:hypothetical protein